ncbi:MAG: RNA polymerase factor sigma-32 [Polyangiaceae bacterium]|nr:RNA polymerase factor sigma-32 [Polyangiaceae bacterium]
MATRKRRNQPSPSPSEPPAAAADSANPSAAAHAAPTAPVSVSDASGGEDEEREASDEEAVIETTGEFVEAREPVGGALPEPKSAAGSLARFDAMQAYMREVARHPLLSPEEEHSLAVRYSKTGDVDAAARLVTANLRLVVKIAYEYRRAYRNMMDLVQEGNIGLMQAVKRYDPYRGVKLSSYAAWWIRAYMLRFILNNWRLVKIGTTQAQRKLFFNLSKEKARLTALGIEPTHAEIAHRLNVEEKDVIEMDRRLARGDASLDAPVSESDGRGTTRLDLLPASSFNPELIAEDVEIQGILRTKLDEFRETLQGKDVQIFEKRMICDEPLTLQQLGDEFGVSRERVRQLEARLYGRLREFLRESLGDSVGVSR